MSKKPDVGAELYAFITGEGASWTVAAIAKHFQLRAPLVTHYVVEYCVKNHLPLPAFKLQSDRAKVKKVKRGSKERDIRISQLSLEKANLGEEMRFKLVFEPRLQLILLLPEDAAMDSFQDVIEAMQGLEQPQTPTLARKAAPAAAAQKPTRSKLKALRSPQGRKEKTAVEA